MRNPDLFYHKGVAILSSSHNKHRASALPVDKQTGKPYDKTTPGLSDASLLDTMSEQQQELIKIDALRGRSLGKAYDKMTPDPSDASLLDTMSEQELRALNAYRLRLRRRNKEYALMAAKKLAEHKALMEELESLTEENRHLLHLGPRGVDVQNKMVCWNAMAGDVLLTRDKG